jgi:hypothetical protein
LQEKATKWQENREIDGLTTNGVLIMHPRGSFCGGEAKCGMWREVSVGGGVFSMRESRSAQQKGVVVSINIVPSNRERLQTDFSFFVRLVLILLLATFAHTHQMIPIRSDFPTEIFFEFLFALCNFIQHACYFLSGPYILLFLILLIR